MQLGCKVIIAAEGAQEKLLKTEFPDLTFINLPGYQIKYSTNKRFFPVKIILQLPKIFFAIRRENRWLKRYILKTQVDAIISDNRYGLYHPALPSVYITHQLLVKAPFSLVERIMQRINYSLIEKFEQCWVPDEKKKVNLAGELSNPKRLPGIRVDYIGGLSRLSKQKDLQKRYDLLIIISGPEPQRSVLEKKMLSELAIFEGTALFVRGLPASNEKILVKENIIIKNHLPAKELEEAFCMSDLIISRSGYTTVMDICKLRKKAVLIPTPGQTEQEYLAQHLEKQGWCLSMQQDDFSLIQLLHQVEHFEYKLPHLPMEAYKDVIDHFVENLKS